MPLGAACRLCDNCDGLSRQPWRRHVRPRLRAAVFDSVILRSESHGGKDEIGSTQHVSSVPWSQRLRRRKRSSMSSLHALDRSNLIRPMYRPPGDPLAHHAAGYAKVMCTAVFMTALAPDFAAENVGYFTAPYGIRTKLGRPV